MATQPIPRGVKKASETPAVEIRKGDSRWEGMIFQWLQEKKPGQLVVGNTSYAVLQDPETTDFFFRALDAQSMYSSRSM